MIIWFSHSLELRTKKPQCKRSLMKVKILPEKALHKPLLPLPTLPSACIGLPKQGSCDATV